MSSDTRTTRKIVSPTVLSVVYLDEIAEKLTQIHEFNQESIPQGKQSIAAIGPNASSEDLFVTVQDELAFGWM